MSGLWFQLSGSLASLPGAAIPVEVRGLDLETVARGVASERIDVEPGRYIALARLPNGDTLSAEVAVEQLQETRVELGSTSSSRASLSSPELLWGTDSHRGEAGAPPVHVSVSPMAVAMHGLRAYVRGAGLASYVPTQVAIEPSIRSVDDCVCVSYDDHQPVDLVHIDVPGRAPVNIVLPRASTANEVLGRGVEIVLSPAIDGTVDATAHLRHQIADAMLQYSGNALLAEAQTVSDGQAMRAEELLRGKTADPLAAAAGAYVLLRLGELSRLHDWTLNLYNWFPWLPDGAAIHGEYLAREGRHEEAVDCMLQLASRGLPMFSDGLAYAARRLQAYTATGTGPLQASLLLEELVPFSLAADFRRAFTTYAGGDPNAPGSVEDEGSMNAPDEDLSYIGKIAQHLKAAVAGPRSGSSAYSEEPGQIA